MVVFPSGVRQISVPWYQIVTISLFDIPIFKDRWLGNSIVEDGTDVDMFDLVVVLVWSSSDLNTSDKNVSKSSGVEFTLDGGSEFVQVRGFLDVESCIPLTVLVGEGNAWRSSLHIAEWRRQSICRWLFRLWVRFPVMGIYGRNGILDDIWFCVEVQWIEICWRRSDWFKFYCGWVNIEH